VRILLASNIYKNTTLHSGGGPHAHSMAKELPCGFIAQQCSVLASFSFTVLFIADAAPWAVGGLMTLSPRDGGPAACASLKATTLISLIHDAFVVCASMMHEPRCRGHMATVTSRSVGSLSFPGWQEHLRPLLTRDPAVYATRQNLTLCQRAPRLH
jgi:hypothetical protein